MSVTAPGTQHARTYVLVPLGSTWLSTLPFELRVKNGRSRGEDVSGSDDARFAVNPIDYRRGESVSNTFEWERHTPLAIRFLMMFSRPTKAPLRMKRMLDVSTAYDSGHSVRRGLISTMAPPKA